MGLIAYMNNTVSLPGTCSFSLNLAQFYKCSSLFLIRKKQLYGLTKKATYYNTYFWFSGIL